MTLRFRIPLQTLAAALDHMGDFPFKDPDLARYDGPALFVRGSKSHYVPDEILPLIGRFFPRFEVRDVDTGHWVISEQPELFRRGTTRTTDAPRLVLTSLVVVDFLRTTE